LTPNLFVATLVGPDAVVGVEPYVIDLGTGTPIETVALSPSCSSVDSEAVPGVRFASFSDHLSSTGATTTTASICRIGGGGFEQVAASLASFMAL
jgi:hypothetical protein